MDSVSVNLFSKFVFSKMNTVVFVLTVYLTISQAWCSYYQKKEKFDIFMPNVTPNRPNLYLCSPVRVDPNRSYYIVGFEPHASMSTVHHLILYGCSTPGMVKPVWHCGEMASSNPEEVSASPCAGGNIILYAWARDAPKLELPEGVAFKIGKDSGISYLVLQIHYGNVDRFKDGSTDTSGLFLHYTKTPLPRAAGVLLLGTVGEIGKNSLESMETACKIMEDKQIHPFAFRVHTHELGVRVAGYRVRPIDGIEHWTMIGERNPMLPQMFYPIESEIRIKKDDIVAATCKMDGRHRNRTTYVGPTADDEMCNFYMMYWVENDGPLEQHYCFSDGPPNYYWNMVLDNIPLKETLTYRKDEDSS